VAVAFVGIDDDRRSRRLRWIFRKQVRQHRAPPSSPDISPGRYWEL
jgi:hypothetical protein